MFFHLLFLIVKTNRITLALAPKTSAASSEKQLKPGSNLGLTDSLINRRNIWIVRRIFLRDDPEIRRNKRINRAQRPLRWSLNWENSGKYRREKRGRQRRFIEHERATLNHRPALWVSDRLAAAALDLRQFPGCSGSVVAVIAHKHTRGTRSPRRRHKVLHIKLEFIKAQG